MSDHGQNTESIQATAAHAQQWSQLLPWTVCKKYRQNHPISNDSWVHNFQPNVITDFEDPICQKYLQRMCCHGNMKHCILPKFCAEVLIIMSNDTSKFSKDWLRNSVTVTSLLRWMGWFGTSADLQMCCHGNIKGPILLKFATKIQLSISNKCTNVC